MHVHNFLLAAISFLHDDDSLTFFLCSGRHIHKKKCSRMLPQQFLRPRWEMKQYGKFWWRLIQWSDGQWATLMFDWGSQNPGAERASADVLIKLVWTQAQHPNVCYYRRRSEEWHTWKKFSLVVIIQTNSLTGVRSWGQKVGPGDVIGKWRWARKSGVVGRPPEPQQRRKSESRFG